MSLLVRSLNPDRPTEKITVDRRGKIKCGKRRPGKELPMSIDYFNVEKFLELRQTYGETPKNLVIFMPNNDIETFFSEGYSLYAGVGDPVKVRQCDGETCIHRIRETVELMQDERLKEVTFQAEEITPCICKNMPEFIPNEKKPGEEKPNPKRCRYTMHLKAYIGLPPKFALANPSCYLIESHSENSGINILSELRRIKRLNDGIITGIPFVLSVNMASSRVNANLKFPIMHLQMLGFIEHIKTDRSLVSGLDEDYIAMLEPPIVAGLTEELEEIGKDDEKTIGDLDLWYEENSEEISKLSVDDKNLLRKKYSEIKKKLETRKKGE